MDKDHPSNQCQHIDLALPIQTYDKFLAPN